MRFFHKISTAFAALIALPTIAVAATIGGTYYMPQYDYRDFFAATDHKQFQVGLQGSAFPGVDPETVARALLPAMQRAKPRPALTFTYARPSPPPSPDYRLVLVFDPANNLNAAPVCAGTDLRFRQGKPGVFYVYAIYCRNDQALSFTTARTAPARPTHARIERRLPQRFMRVFRDHVQRPA